MITTNTNRDEQSLAARRLMFPAGARGQGAHQRSEPVQLLLDRLTLPPLQAPERYLPVESQRQSAGGLLQPGLLSAQTLLAPAGLLRGCRSLCGAERAGQTSTRQTTITLQSVYNIPQPVSHLSLTLSQYQPSVTDQT